MHSFEIESLKENAKDIKILYVENHAGTRLKFSRFLKKYFVNVTVVTFADNAVQLFLSGYFDLIITDTNLLDMEVSDMCRKIKHIAPRKPIVIISNLSDSSVLIELINIGVAGFITTPYEEENVIKILSKIVLNISDMQILYKILDQVQENSTYVEKKDIKSKNNNALNNSNLNLLLYKYEHISAKDFIEIYPKDLFVIGDQLLSIIEDIDLYINQFINHTSHKNALNIVREFEEFSNIVGGVQEFTNISFSVQKLAILFATLDYSKSYTQYYDLILLISGELLEWCENIFMNKDVEDIHYLDKSLLADTLMLENFLKGSQNVQEDDNSLEFF